MANVKLLLNESIKNVGRVGDVVEVSPGFARNYLIPNRLAVQPTPSNMKRVEALKQEVERLEREKRADQERMIKQLEGVEVHLERRANEQGHLFGSVTATDIAKELQNQKFNIEASDISLPGRLDRIDTYTVRVKFAEDLAADLKVWVNADPESKAAIDAARKNKDKDAAPAADEE
jgi:large subunit ribosomal protein L9